MSALVVLLWIPFHTIKYEICRHQTHHDNPIMPGERGPSPNFWGHSLPSPRFHSPYLISFFLPTLLFFIPPSCHRWEVATKQLQLAGPGDAISFTSGNWAGAPVARRFLVYFQAHKMSLVTTIIVVFCFFSLLFPSLSHSHFPPFSSSPSEVGPLNSVRRSRERCKLLDQYRGPGQNPQPQTNFVTLQALKPRLVTITIHSLIAQICVYSCTNSLEAYFSLYNCTIKSHAQVSIAKLTRKLTAEQFFAAP